MKLLYTIDSLKETYLSIDIRLFSVLKDDVWQNVFTIIRFRSESVKELKKIHDAESEKYGGLIQTDKYKVSVHQLPIEKWDKVKSDFEQKFLCLSEDYAVNYENPITLNHNLVEPHKSEKEYVFKEWNVFFAQQEARHEKPPYEDELLDHALKKGFSLFHYYLSAVFQMDKYDFQMHSWVYLFVPVFFKINDVFFEFNKMDITYSSYFQHDLELVVNFTKQKKYGIASEFICKISKSIELEKTEKRIQKTITLPLHTSIIGNTFEIIIKKNETVLIANKKDNIGNCWKGQTEFTNPFYFAFEKFVSYETFEKILFDFESENFKDKSKVFEQGISWILNLLGIPNIIFDKYETIRKNSKIISSDILGKIDKNTLIMAHVTTGFPRPSDFDKVREYRKNFNDLIKNENIQIKSIYFTGSEPTESKTHAESNDVLLIGLSSLNLILEHLKKGEIIEARNIVTRELDSTNGF